MVVFRLNGFEWEQNLLEQKVEVQFGKNIFSLIKAVMFGFDVVQILHLQLGAAEGTEERIATLSNIKTEHNTSTFAALKMFVINHIVTFGSNASIKATF